MAHVARPERSCMVAGGPSQTKRRLADAGFTQTAKGPPIGRKQALVREQQCLVTSPPDFTSWGTPVSHDFTCLDPPNGVQPTANSVSRSVNSPVGLCSPPLQPFISQRPVKACQRPSGPHETVFGGSVSSLHTSKGLLIYHQHGYKSPMTSLPRGPPYSDLGGIHTILTIHLRNIRGVYTD